MSALSLTTENTLLAVIDMQEKFAPAIHNFQETASRTAVMAAAAAAMKIPLVFTEQYPKGLGPTIPELAKFMTPETPRVEKACFSCFGEEAFRKLPTQLQKTTLILCGVESHVCVLQTALDALERGYEVFVPGDAVSSRHEPDKLAALAFLTSRGVNVVNTESIIFMLLKTSASPFFKAVQKIVK